MPFDNGERPLANLPQMRSMILLTTRPPQLETPFAAFNEGVLTPNNAFFVRYHLSGLPTVIDPATFRLALASLKRDFPVHEVVAVNQCSGNTLPADTEPSGLAQPDTEIVVSNCSACHSLDYIATQPRRKGPQFWCDEATKMLNVYKAPIAPADADAVAAALARKFG